MGGSQRQAELRALRISQLSDNAGRRWLTTAQTKALSFDSAVEPFRAGEAQACSASAGGPCRKAAGVVTFSEAADFVPEQGIVRPGGRH